MRIALLALLFANVVFLVYTQGYFGNDNGPTPAGDLNADKIRLLSAQQVGKLPVLPKAPPVAATSATQMAMAASACLEWGSFSSADLGRVEKLLADLSLGDKLSSRKVEETASFWVFIPPQANKGAAEKKVQELKKLGVAEYFVIQDVGPQHYAISLGIFKTEEAAKSRLDALKQSGVRSAQLGSRAMQVQKTYFQIRDGQAATAAKLAEIRQEFPGSEIRDCSP